ncbi:MAG: Xanthine dehydrogenase accessory protein XdhC [Ramlibacter sp.]|jgi:xanthine dehydrogenase accessory factor|nr:Xanthine dehydrogenase accessory protein XdhC [Ramlibacter sp.]
MQPIEEVTARLPNEHAVLVSVDAAQGSVPREQGAWMAVFARDFVGTIGGGHLELQAIEEARRRLAGSSGPDVLRYPLGPSLGQCCGGIVFLRFQLLMAADAAALPQRLQRGQAPLALFGGGHVGKALINVLGTLPFAVTWIDSRDEIFPQQVPDNVSCEHSDPVQAAVAELAPHSRVLIMSFSHAEDLDIVAACLQRLRTRGDLPYVGLIGSKTKWATFRHRLEERGFHQQELAQVTCPIGVPGIRGKEPAVIAVAVAAQLLQGL